jgi:hypothetical protein
MYTKEERKRNYRNQSDYYEGIAILTILFYFSDVTIKENSFYR